MSTNELVTSEYTYEMPGMQEGAGRKRRTGKASGKAKGTGKSKKPAGKKPVRRVRKMRGGTPKYFDDYLKYAMENISPEFSCHEICLYGLYDESTTKYIDLFTKVKATVDAAAGVAGVAGVAGEAAARAAEEAARQADLEANKVEEAEKRAAEAGTQIGTKVIVGTELEMNSAQYAGIEAAKYINIILPKKCKDDESLQEQVILSEIENSSAPSGGRPRKSSAKPKASAKASGKKPSKAKKGGALMDDLQNLAVPFAILLAKQGLDTMFGKDKKGASSSSGAEKKKVTPKKKTRRASMSGGDCGCGAASSTGASEFASFAPSATAKGGAKKPKRTSTSKKPKSTPKKGGTSSLAETIDNFLRKY